MHTSSDGRRASGHQRSVCESVSANHQSSPSKYFGFAGVPAAKLIVTISCTALPPSIFHQDCQRRFEMIRQTAFLSLVALAVSFQPRGVQRHRRPSTSLSSYLDSLSQQVPQSAALSSAPVQSATPLPSEGAAAATPSFVHAPIGYFGLDQLESKGPRTADWGTPQDSTRLLTKDGMLSAGSWFCSEGGWDSPNPKAHTEIFYMLTGHGCLSDADRTRHYFGPGDTVIIPKGHTGRWDVVSPIHKIWAVNAHESVEDRNPVIRVQVDGYHTFAPQNLVKNTGYDPLYGSTHASIAYNTFYDVGPTQVGVWTCGSASFPVSIGQKTFFHLLEGVVIITDNTTGHGRRCVAGDTVVLPEGWSGHLDVSEPAKKLWTTAN